MDVERAVELAHREEHGQIFATLMGQFGDFDLVEEAVQDAFVAALQTWKAQGVPTKPGAWLTTVARRKAIDRLRKGQAQLSRTELIDDLASVPSETKEEAEAFEIPDERLKLIFTCCHPALPIEQQIGLTLKTLGGLETAEIAAAFLVPEATVAQRIVRAKRKIKDAGIPYYLPPAHLLAERIQAVTFVIYLIFTEGYAATFGEALIRHELCDNAIRLCRVLEMLIRQNNSDVPPGQYAEVVGLLALMLLHHSRRHARVGQDGKLVLLPAQDRSRWDPRGIQEGLALLEKAQSLGQPGAFQLQAAISGAHARAATAEATDWAGIALLYDSLLNFDDTPVVRLNRAVAVSLARGPQDGLDLLGDLSSELGSYAPYHLAMADMHKRLGNSAAAVGAYRAALSLTDNVVERKFIEEQIQQLPK